MMRRSGAGLVTTRSGKSRNATTVSLCASAGSTHSGMPTRPRPASASPFRTRPRRVIWVDPSEPGESSSFVMRLKISRDPHPLAKLCIYRVHEVIGGQIRMVLADQNRQVFRHAAGFNHVD